MKYLLDTCTVSYFLKENTNIIKHMQSVTPSELAISVITLLEIEYGFKLKNSKHMSLLYQKQQLFLNVINVVKFNNKTALIAANIRALLKLQGQMIGAYDILITASALEHEMICITNNLSEFKRVEKLKLLDWSVNT